MDEGVVIINLHEVKGVIVINNDIFDLPIIARSDLHKAFKDQPLQVHVLIHDGEYVGTADYFNIDQFQGVPVENKVTMMDVYSLVDYDDLSKSAQKVIRSVCKRSIYEKTIVAVSANGTHIRCFDYTAIAEHYIKRLSHNTMNNRKWILPEGYGLTTADNILLLYYIGRNRKQPPKLLNTLCHDTLDSITGREDREHAERGLVWICTVYFIVTLIWQILTNEKAQWQVMSFLGIVYQTYRHIDKGTDPWLLRYWRRVKRVEDIVPVLKVEKQILKDKNAHLILQYMFENVQVPLDVPLD
jgi:hypothetical protein